MDIPDGGKRLPGWMHIPSGYVTPRFVEQLGAKPGGVWAVTNARRVAMTGHG